MATHTNHRVKLTAAVLLLATAALLWAYRERLFSAEDSPAGDDARTAWYCVECERGFELLPREYEGRVYQGMPPGLTVDAGEQIDMTLAVSLVACPNCGKGAVFARKCPDHGSIFDPRREGRVGGCPRCDRLPLDD